MAESKPHNVAPMLFALMIMNMSIIVLVILYNQRPSAPAAASDDAKAPAKIEAFLQTDTISPGTKFTGQFFYPIPYGSPPSLRIISDDKKRVYEVVREDEFGFSWMIRPAVEDIAEATAKAASKPEDLLRFRFDTFMAENFKPNLRFSDFKYEARGVVGGGKAARPIEQSGTFNTMPASEGEVIFPVAYAAPANVELSGSAASYVVLVECKATGFKWKNNADKTSPSWSSGSVAWKSRGMREK